MRFLLGSEVVSQSCHRLSYQVTFHRKKLLCRFDEAYYSSSKLSSIFAAGSLRHKSTRARFKNAILFAWHQLNQPRVMQLIMASIEEIHGDRLLYCIQSRGQRVIKMLIDCKILINEDFISECLRKSNIWRISSILQIIWSSGILQDIFTHISWVFCNGASKLNTTCFLGGLLKCNSNFLFLQSVFQIIMTLLFDEIRQVFWILQLQLTRVEFGILTQNADEFCTKLQLGVWHSLIEVSHRVQFDWNPAHFN